MSQTRAAGIAGLYAVTPDIADTALLVRKVDAAIRGGAAVIQYRNKTADAALQRQPETAPAGNFELIELEVEQGHVPLQGELEGGHEPAALLETEIEHGNIERGVEASLIFLDDQTGRFFE